MKDINGIELKPGDKVVYGTYMYHGRNKADLAIGYVEEVIDKCLNGEPRTYPAVIVIKANTNRRCRIERSSKICKL